MSSSDCIIYCTGKISINELKLRVAELVGATKIEVSFIEKDFFEISIYKNDAFDVTRQTEFPDGFLCFQFIIEIGFKENYEIDKCVFEVSKILEYLWSINIASVAFCEYEELLPNKGGYNSSVTPWPTI
jgi:hypothetical protein